MTPLPLPPGETRPMPDQLWVYRARLTRIVDADSLDISVDCGLRAYRTERLRLLLANAPELRGPSHEAGAEATRFTASWLARHQAGVESEGWPLRIQTEKSDVFGRWLAWVWAADDGACLNDEILASGNAVVYQRKPRKAAP